MEACLLPIARCIVSYMWQSPPSLSTNACMYWSIDERLPPSHRVGPFVGWHPRSSHFPTGPVPHLTRLPFDCSRDHARSSAFCNTSSITLWLGAWALYSPHRSRGASPGQNPRPEREMRSFMQPGEVLPGKLAEAEDWETWEIDAEGCQGG